METPGATIPEIARLLGISENAVLQRIKRGTLSANRDGNGKWRVVISHTDQRPTDDRPTNHQSNHPSGLDTEKFPIQTQQESAALVIREAIAPFVERLEKVNQELGQIKAQKDALLVRVLELETTLSMSSASPNAPQGTKGHDEQEMGRGDFIASERGIQSPNRSIIERLKRLFTGQ
jgi:hypothetical protein